jgi:drug/metabolite transporter (DMT)-like permease
MTEPRTPRPLDFAGVAVMIFCCALWGGNSVAVKFANGDTALPPLGCAALRFVISLPIVALFCYQGGTGFLPARRDWWLLLINGAFTALQIGTYNWGTAHSEAGRSSVFINIHPLITVALARLVLGEHLGTRGMLGLVASVFGVSIILARQFRGGGGLDGDLVVLASGLIFAIQTIVQKLTFPRIPSRTLLFGQTLIALPITLIGSLVTEGTASYHFTRPAIWGLLYQGLLSSGLCFSLWMILLNRYQAGRLATIAFVTPVFGLTFANLFRGDPLTTPLLIGGGLVGLGIYLVASGRIAPSPDPATA